MTKCKHCNENFRLNPFKMGYAERVKSLIIPWKYVHKVPQYGVSSNLSGSWPTLRYKREKCTRDES